MNPAITVSQDTLADMCRIAHDSSSAVCTEPRACMANRQGDAFAELEASEWQSRCRVLDAVGTRTRGSSRTCVPRDARQRPPSRRRHPGRSLLSRLDVPLTRESVAAEVVVDDLAAASDGGLVGRPAITCVASAAGTSPSRDSQGRRLSVWPTSIARWRPWPGRSTTTPTGC